MPGLACKMITAVSVHNDTPYCPLHPLALTCALQVVAGYMRESDLARARVPIPEEFMLTAGRLGAWPSLIMAHYLVPSASLPGGTGAALLSVLKGLGRETRRQLASTLWRTVRTPPAWQALAWLLC